MGEGRVGSLARLSVHRDIADALDLGRIVDDIIIGTKARENKFLSRRESFRNEVFYQL